MRPMTAIAALVFVATATMAGPFGAFGRRGNPSFRVDYATSPSAGFLTAQDAANHMARIGRIGHFGGNRGYEGVGAGVSPSAAEWNCCFRKQMAPREVGIAQGINGMFYACCRY